MASLIEVNRRPVDLPPPITSVTLRLEAREAQLLTSVLRRVGGDIGGDRGKVDDILRVLRVAGLPELQDLTSKAGSIYFPNEPLAEKVSQ